MTHCKSLKLACRPDWMVGNATITIEYADQFSYPNARDQCRQLGPSYRGLR
jgi:hypothetical protein